MGLGKRGGGEEQLVIVTRHEQVSPTRNRPSTPQAPHKGPRTPVAIRKGIPLSPQNATTDVPKTAEVVLRRKTNSTIPTTGPRAW